MGKRAGKERREELLKRKDSESRTKMVEDEDVCWWSGLEQAGSRVGLHEEGPEGNVRIDHFLKYCGGLTFKCEQRLSLRFPLAGKPQLNPERSLGIPMRMLRMAKVRRSLKFLLRSVGNCSKPFSHNYQG